MSESTDTAKKRRHRNERIAAAALLAVLGGALTIFLRWNQADEEAFQRERSYIPPKDAITPEVLLLRDYVRIDTSTPDGVATAARWLTGLLARNGVRAEIIESAEGRANVYARIQGKNREGGLLLFHHIDVIPAGGSDWTHPPFGGVIQLNMLHGRGTLDMKGIAICQLLAFLDVARAGRLPEHDIVFLATADEESGSTFGMKWLLEKRPDVFSGIAYGITEGGITEVMTERMAYFGIEVGSKQQVLLKLESKDLGSLEQARFAFEPEIVSREPDRILPAVREYFRRIAPTRIRYRAILNDIDAAVARGDFWRLPATYRDLTQNTVWAGAPVPSGAGWLMHVRLINLPDEAPAQRIEWLKKVVAPFGVRVIVDSAEGPVPMSDTQTSLFRILADEAARRYQVPTGPLVLYRSATDARFLRPLGIICYGVSPYPVDYYQSLTIHRANERIRLDWFQDGTGYMRRAVTAWAFEVGRSESH